MHSEERSYVNAKNFSPEKIAGFSNVAFTDNLHVLLFQARYHYHWHSMLGENGRIEWNLNTESELKCCTV